MDLKTDRQTRWIRIDQIELGINWKSLFSDGNSQFKTKNKKVKILSFYFFRNRNKQTKNIFQKLLTKVPF